MRRQFLCNADAIIFKTKRGAKRKKMAFPDLMDNFFLEACPFLVKMGVFFFFRSLRNTVWGKKANNMSKKREIMKQQTFMFMT